LKQLSTIIDAMSRPSQPDMDRFNRLRRLVDQAANVRNDIDEINILRAELQPKIEALQRRTRITTYRPQLERFKMLDERQCELAEHVRSFKEKLSGINNSLDAIVPNRVEWGNYRQLVREALNC
jgi:uncharacterized coiled-coil DUF342 family protein